jgi:hypothetical protein
MSVENGGIVGKNVFIVLSCYITPPIFDAHSKNCTCHCMELPQQPPPHNASLTLLKGVSECQNGGSDVAIKGLRDAWGGGAGVTSSFQ